MSMGLTYVSTIIADSGCVRPTVSTAQYIVYTVVLPCMLLYQDKMSSRILMVALAETY